MFTSAFLVVAMSAAVAPPPPPSAIVPAVAASSRSRLAQADADSPLPAYPETSDDAAYPLEAPPAAPPAPVFEAGQEDESTSSLGWVEAYREDGAVGPAEGTWPVWAMLGAQLAAGIGIGLVFAPPALALMAASTVLLPNAVFQGLGDTGAIIVIGGATVGGLAIVAPAVIAGAQTLIGDWIGPRRGALVWPLLAAYIAAGATWMTTAVGFSATLGVLNKASRRGESVAILPVLVTAALVPAVVGLVLTVAAPAVTYAFASEEKRVGDDGHGIPGLLAPAHAAEERPLPNLRTASTRESASAQTAVRF